jgi:hypothetical protein
MKILAGTQNIGVSWKYWWIPKILAGVQNIGGCPNIGGHLKYWRVSKILAPAENQAALLFRLGGISCC